MPSDVAQRLADYWGSLFVLGARLVFIANGPGPPMPGKLVWRPRTSPLGFESS